MYVIQAAILILIFFVAGYIAGKLLHHLFAAQTSESNPPLSDNAQDVSESPKTSVSVESVEVSRAKPASDPDEKFESAAAEEISPTPPPEKKVEPPAAKPVVSPAPVAADDGIMAKDNLQKIKGIGPKIEASLNGLGITSFPQIAAWSDEDQREIGENLSFPGRIEREEWVEQAKALAKGLEPSPKPDVALQDDAPPSAEEPEESPGSRPPAQDMPENGGDDLTLIEGIGSALEKKLNAVGVHTLEQISKWNSDHQVWIGNEIGFGGRPERENWVAEAKALLKGDKPKEPPKPKRGMIVAKRKGK